MSRPEQRRIETFDLLRGFFLLVIFVDHFAHFPSLFDLITGRGELWASAAEGFFIISGLLVGYVRGKQVLQGKFKPAAQKLWQRAAVLFGWSVLLTLIFTWLGRLEVQAPGLKIGLDTTSSAWGLLGNTLSLQYVYGWADFLIYYAVYLFLAPLALWLVKRRLAAVVAAASVLTWLISGTNSFMAWQVFFFLALVVGYYLRPLEAASARLTPTLSRGLRLGIYGAAVATIITSAALEHLPSVLTTHHNLGQAWLEPLRLNLEQWARVYNPWFTKWTFEPGRLVMAAIWFTALYILVRRHEAWVVRRLGWLLLPVGRNSLFVYGAESVLLFALSTLIPGSAGLVLNTVMVAIGLGVVWGLAMLWQRALRAARPATQASVAK